MIIFGILLALVAGYGVQQASFYSQRRRLERADWAELLAKLQPVNVEGVAEIAENFLHPSKSQLRIEPGVMWDTIGGIEGLQALDRNAKAMLHLATFASRWDRVEGRIVAEMIRRDGVRLARAVRQIELARYLGVRVVFAPFLVQEAAATYHLMRGRLLGLYQVAHVGLYPRLVEVV